MILFTPIKEESQRVPHKNFRQFCGRPLYEYVLQKLNCYPIYVDTDSNKIIENIKTNPDLSHVVAYKRETNLVGHEVSVCSLIESLISRWNIKEPVCQFHVTSPFIKLNTLLEAHKILKQGYDSVVSCTKHNARFWREEKYGMCPVNHNPTKLEQTQDLPTMLEENSLFYLFHPEVIMRTGNRIGSNPYFYETSFPENIDIDTEEDWSMAQLLEGQG